VNERMHRPQRPCVVAQDNSDEVLPRFIALGGPEPSGQLSLRSPCREGTENVGRQVNESVGASRMSPVRIAGGMRGGLRAGSRRRRRRRKNVGTRRAAS
jgi:hypothetical protein